jgi:hypothetical protein
MQRGPTFRSGQQLNPLFIVGWAVVVALGIALVWLGFAGNGRDRGPSEAQPSAAALSTPGQALPWPTSPSMAPATGGTPLPTVPIEPTAIPATATPAIPMVTAGTSGVNVRNGPGINYTLLGYLEPGAQAEVVGRSSDWWQIRYAGGLAWVINQYVTATGTESVPQVGAPPPPAPPPATATPVPPPPTATPQPAANFRGLVPNAYVVEGAPGPFEADKKIWFQFSVTNLGQTVDYSALGTLVDETGQFQKSWTNERFLPGQTLDWRDNLKIPAPGTYNLWLVVCFTDNECFRMRGPVTITVQ